MMRRIQAGALWGLTVLLGLTTPARAEWFGDLYGGGAFTGSRDVSVSGGSGGSNLRNVNFNTSGVVGGRAGYWLADFEYLGFALDALHYRPNLRAQTVRTDAAGLMSLGATDLRATTLGFDVLLRYPLLRTAEMPHGHLQPYFLLGPVVAFVAAKDTINFGPPGRQSQSSTRAGFNVGGGTLWQFHKHLGVFAEYRYLQFTPNFTFANSTEVQFTVNTQLLLGGVSIRF